MFPKKALAYIKSLAGTGSKQVIVLHVINDKRIESMTQGIAWAGKDVATYLKELQQDLENEARDKAASIESELAAAAFDVKVRIESGGPHSRILEVAAEEGISAIVIGSHGRSNLGEMLLARCLSMSSAIPRNRSWSSLNRESRERADILIEPAVKHLAWTDFLKYEAIIREGEKRETMMEKQEHVPENAIFCCFGCMFSVGTLTGVAVLEAYKGLDKEKTGLFCTSAIAAGVPKHRKTTEKAKTIIVIDGCQNRCATKILENDRINIDKSLNLVQDLKIPKVGPFKPFDFREEDMKKTVAEIIRLCQH